MILCRCGLHHSLQSLQLAYSRVTILFISSTLNKYFYWKNKGYFSESNDEIKRLYYEFNDIINEIYYIENIINMNSNILVPEIKYEDKKIFNIIIEKVRNDGLKFKYEYNEFAQYHSMILLEYLLNSPNFILNPNTLNHIYKNLFDKKFAEEFLRRKCFQFGFEYQSS